MITNLKFSITGINIVYTIITKLTLAGLILNVLLHVLLLSFTKSSNLSTYTLFYIEVMYL